MYRIIGADGKEYGPVSADQMRQWIAEGRINSQTRVLAEGTTQWKTIAEMPEFAAPAAAPPPGAMPPPTMSAIPAASYGYPRSGSDQLNGPGIAMIVLGALNIVLVLIRLAFTLAGIGMSSLAGNSAENDAGKMLVGFFATFGLAILGVGLIGALIILFGGIKMRRMENYSLCMVASIVAMIPCVSCCFLIGIPIGIWSLVILSKPEVKNAFH
jgi:hypothetical protein